VEDRAVSVAVFRVRLEGDDVFVSVGPNQEQQLYAA
jgi:hypothetical protein